MNLGQLLSLIHCNCGMDIEIYPTMETVKCTHCNRVIDLEMKNFSEELTKLGGK